MSKLSSLLILLLFGLSFKHVDAREQLIPQCVCIENESFKHEEIASHCSESINDFLNDYGIDIIFKPEHYQLIQEYAYECDNTEGDFMSVDEFIDYYEYNDNHIVNQIQAETVGPTTYDFIAEYIDMISRGLQSIIVFPQSHIFFESFIKA